ARRSVDLSLLALRARCHGPSSLQRLLRSPLPGSCRRRFSEEPDVPAFSLPSKASKPAGGRRTGSDRRDRASRRSAAGAGADPAMIWLLDFSNPLAREVAAAGGKGSSLARLFQAGFPVPAGLIVPVAADLAFRDGDQRLERALEELDFA